jgi:flagellar assembly protein FliH
VTSSSSKPPGREPPPAPGSRSTGAYARFIPREELQGFAAWAPESLVDEAAAARDPDVDPATAVDLEGRLASARQAGYRDGYRDGLEALEAFKRSHAAQVSVQAGELLKAIDEGFQALEGLLAEAVAGTAVALARQVLRTELAAHPQRVARVASEAVAAVLGSARRIELHLHPDDLPLVAAAAADAEALAARGARLVADASVARGGCLVESDLGRIDARIESRWSCAAAALGAEQPWQAAQDAA